ncbi:MAG: shikimate dehydrogenase [Propionicimonas sp.]
MKAAVLGSPVAHSLSPVLHAAGYAELGLADWSYDRFDLQAADLPGFVAGLDADWRGLSLTMPLKEACLTVAAEVGPLARRAGAGNTLVRLSTGAWRADNTDVPGLVDALRPTWEPDWTLAAILGAGATARSALLALCDLGVTRVHLFARNPARARDFVAWAAAAAPQVELMSAPLEGWASGSEPAVVSTLPGGAADGFLLSGPRAGLLFDAVYAGWPTALARSAGAAGMTVVGGLDLLVHQAARQFTLFTGRPAPLAAMFAAGRAAQRPFGLGEAR